MTTVRYPRLVQVIALLLCVALVYGASLIAPSINEGRQRLNMYGDEDVLASTPPEYAFAIQAFGAFRSLIVNVAFIRAEKYKEEGRYYDAKQLAEWICKLQPRFPSVWEFHSWNMAWNISVTTHTAEERWNWVYNGVRLLRDEGIPYNPRAVNLYKQLAWIFNNKMGEIMDDFHWEYKRNWAWRMHLLLGPPPVTAALEPDEEVGPVVFDVVDDPLLEMARITAEQHEERRRLRQQEEEVPFRTTRSLEERLEDIPTDLPTDEVGTQVNARKRAARDFLQAIDDAPRTLAGLYEQNPKTREMVAQLRELGVVITDDALDEDSYWYDGKLAATFFWRYRQLSDRRSLKDVIKREDGEEGPSAREQELGRFDEIVGVRAGDPDGQALLRFLQRKVLTEVYKLQPERMIILVEHFGPVDWRLTDTQSLYWVAEGLIKGGETLSTFENDKTNTARILFFSLRNLFHRNRLTFEPHPDDPKRSYLNYAPDMDFIEPMHRAFLTYGPMIDPDPGDVAAAGSLFRSGHVNFLSEAIRMLWFSDRIAEADHYYAYLREHYSVLPHGEIDARYTRPLRDFVVQTLYGNVDGPRETDAVVKSLLLQAYNELSNQNTVAYNRLVAKALDFYEAYMGRKRVETGPRMQLPPFQDYQIDAFQLWLETAPTLADMRVGPETVAIYKSRLWRVAPVSLKQWVYDDLIEMFRYECELSSFDVAKAFAEPPGMDEFRRLHPRREVDVQKRDAESPPDP